MSAKKTGSIVWKVLLGILVAVVVLGGLGLAYGIGRMHNSPMYTTYPFSNRTADDDCPMFDGDENGTEGAVAPNQYDRYEGGMMGGRGDYWGRGSMMGGRFGVMPYGRHGFFPLGGLLGGLLFIALIVLVVRLLVGGSRWHRHMHGWGPHHMHREDCPYCREHGSDMHHHHEDQQGDTFEEPELNIDED